MRIKCNLSNNLSNNKFCIFFIKFNNQDQDKHYQANITTKEAIEDDQLEEYAERLVATQLDKRYNVYPIQKAKEKLGLEARGCPVIIATDSSKIRIQPQPKDIFYRPEHSRDRLSINWS